MSFARWLGWAALAGAIAWGCGGVTIDPPDPPCPGSLHAGASCEPRKASCPVQEGPCAVTYRCEVDDPTWAVASTVCSPAAVGCGSDGDVCETPGDQCATDVAVPCGNFAYCESDHHWHLPTCDPPGPDHCPDLPPSPDQPCDGWNLPPVCAYGFVCGEVSSASCTSSGIWSVTVVDCPPAPGCADHTESACGADVACRWLVPGCGDPALPAAGCFPVEDCAPGGCAAGLACEKVVYDPCYQKGCAACGADALVCR